jgi:hypothetical protein
MLDRVGDGGNPVMIGRGAEAVIEAGAGNAVAVADLDRDWWRRACMPSRRVTSWI